MLRRLRKLGASQTDMLDVYYTQVRCVLEFGVAVWASGLTMAEATQIERVQKCALHVILGVNYISYENSLEILKTEKLSERRSKIYLKFIKECEKKHKIFKLAQIIRTEKTNRYENKKS